MPTLTRTTSDNPDFQSLVTLLDQDLLIRDGEEHAFYHQFNKITNLREVVVAYVDDQPVGCGAFREFDANTVEIKRMFVQPVFRGQGIAGRVLKELETWAAEQGYTACVLETGKKQPEAIALYHKSGYEIIPSYGQYEYVENSVCMRKDI